MGNISSGHFKPTNNIQEKHNDRTLSPSYLLPEEFRGQNEVNRSSDQARQLKERIIENAISIYEQTKKKNAPKFKAKSYLWSLVVNIKTNTTMSDLKKLAEHFDLKYGFQCYQIAIHRDEGYIDENNQPHTNHHAHMEFVTLNKENGKNMMRKAHLSPKKFADMQTEIAQILGMERGISGNERIEPRKYAQMKNKERKALNSLKQEKDKEINTLKQEKTELESIIQEKDKEIATALDTANCYFRSKAETLQEAVERCNKQSEKYLAMRESHENRNPDFVEEMTKKHQNDSVFTNLFNAIKERFSLKKLVASIKKILFGDENAEKDPQEIEQKIKELSERPTKTELINQRYYRNEAVKHYQEAEKIVFNGKTNSWTLVTDDDAKKLNERLTELMGKESKLNTLESADLAAIELEKAQERVKTLESNENTLKNDLNAKETTINELKKQKEALEYNYNQERERMKAENKRLQEQGMDKIYTQKDYEALKAEHNEQIEALKNKIQEQEKTIKITNIYRRNAENAKIKQIQQRRKMNTPRPTPSAPTPQPTYTKRM